ncbi:50S ribosomal protein L25 [Acetivibrio thermocellus]|uniref:50S ribosomal protein L25 n=1 Tax=Acetivibrio thermocellus TaxID=1515 RepID=UPI0010A5ECAA|nr:50S ribosomal protein L25 [Acetivibrio thermocellus]THJ78960.1 50S ribosomal protein L25 [Acetivibrio thermocellus]
MEGFELNIENRTALGTSASRKVKREGKIPGVLYQGDKSIPISLIEDEIRPIVDKNGSDVLVNVNLNGKRIKAKIHEVQRKPVSDEILHVDLMPLDGGKEDSFGVH